MGRKSKKSGYVYTYSWFTFCTAETNTAVKKLYSNSYLKKERKLLSSRGRKDKGRRQCCKRPGAGVGGQGQDGAAAGCSKRAGAVGNGREPAQTGAAGRDLPGGLLPRPHPVPPPAGWTESEAEGHALCRPEQSRAEQSQRLRRQAGWYHFHLTSKVKGWGPEG